MLEMVDGFHDVPFPIGGGTVPLPKPLVENVNM